MIIRKLDDIPKTGVDMAGVKGIAKQLVLGSADGVPNFSFRVFTLDPDGHSPRHEHDLEHLNYVLSGEGCLVDGNGNRLPLVQGDFALVTPGETHQFRNTGEEPFVFLCAVPRAYE